MSWMSKAVPLAIVGAAGMTLLMTTSAGCSETQTSTTLKPEGPPEVLQVFVLERVTRTNAGGTETVVTSKQLAYGDHPDIDRDEDDRQVSNAVADSQQQLRMVFDELLVGNNLEEIACFDPALTDCSLPVAQRRTNLWSRVPVGTSPDDLAACSGSLDEVSKNCKTDVCRDPNGMLTGILDCNLDGAVDKLRFIEGAVTLECGGIEMPLDMDKTFHQPSGNQLIPAGSGIDGLGPAIILAPASGLRTGAACTIRFADTIVDKEGIAICAPAAGATCAPGDTSGIRFMVEPLRVTSSAPRAGADNVNPAAAALIQVRFNAELLLDANPGIAEVTANGAPVANTTLTLNPNNLTNITIALADGYAPGTTYQVTLSGFVDHFGGVMPQPSQISFTTLPDTTPDAGPPDAGIDAGLPDAGIDAMP